MPVLFLLSVIITCAAHAGVPCEPDLTPIVPLVAPTASIDSDLVPRHFIEALIAEFPAMGRVLARLDLVFRTGWRRSAVPDTEGESVLSHTVNVARAVVAYVRGRANFDLERAIWMALIHDVPEYTVPDYTPDDGIPPSVKYREEERALEQLVEWLGPRSAFMLNLWREFEANFTLEARVVYQLDKLDAAVRALEYDRRGFDVDRFFVSIDRYLVDPELIRVWAHMKSLRKTPGIDYHEVYFRRLAQSGTR